MEIRGTGVRSLLLAIEKVHGKEGLSSVKAALPAPIRARLEPGVLSLQWYPVEVSASVHVAVRAVLGHGSWELSHALGLAASKLDFSGIYRIMVRAVSYNSIWERSQLAWGQYNSQGKAEWVSQGDGTAVGAIHGVTGYNMGLWQSVAGRMQGMLEMAGVRAANVAVVEGTSAHARFDAIWLP